MQAQSVIENPESVSFEDTSVAFSFFSNYDLKRFYFILKSMNHQGIAKLGTFLMKVCIFLHFPIKYLIKSTIYDYFCGGETLNECDDLVNKLYKSNIGAVLDYSVDVDFKQSAHNLYFHEILKSIEMAHKFHTKSFAVFKVSSLCDPLLLEKVSTDKKLSEEITEEWKSLRQKIEGLCFKAHHLGVRVFIEAEESWVQDKIDLLAFEMMSRYNTEKCIVFNTFQMYRIDMLDNLKAAIETAKNNYFLGVKLVRGAYIEKERTKAHEEKYCDPIFKTKSETDVSYNEAVKLCVDSYKVLNVCVGTHNMDSCKVLCKLMEEANIDSYNPHFIFSQLLGFSDHISFNLAKSGYNVVKFIPYGPINDTIPFLLHRAAENPDVAYKSNKDFELVKIELLRRKLLRDNLLAN